MHASKPTKLFAAALLPAIGALAMVGCGGSSSPSTSKTADISKQKAQSQFEACLRQHGVNLTPSSSPGGPVTFRLDRNTPAFQSAFQACRSYLRKAFGNITPAQRAEFRQQAVKFTQCLRAHGQNVPDPTFNDAAPGGGPQTSSSGGASRGGGPVRQVFAGVDRNSPGFQAAVQACQSVAPKPPGGGIRIGVGGPGPGAASAKP